MAIIKRIVFMTEIYGQNCLIAIVSVDPREAVPKVTAVVQHYNLSRERTVPASKAVSVAVETVVTLMMSAVTEVFVADVVIPMMGAFVMAASENGAQKGER